MPWCSAVCRSLNTSYLNHQSEDILGCLNMYDAKEVAKLVINVCYDDGNPITNLKLQKILYFLWIDYYKEFHKSLFDDEFHAWRYGPVVPEVYYYYRVNVADPIGRVDEDGLSRSDRDFLVGLIRKYNKESLGALVGRSHQPGSPWEKYYHKDDWDCVIPEEAMVQEAHRDDGRRSS